MSSSKKVYGLILPQKVSKESKPINRPSVFAADDDSSDEDKLIPKMKSSKTVAKKPFFKRQTQLDIEKALADDPNVFEYDEVYDQVQAKRIEQSAAEKSNLDRKPKFIHSLIKTANERKKEDERRIERTIQREREAEKGLYDDKEAFVTESFRQKMREMKEEEENERRKKEMEELTDVTKTKDYTGFYQNLLNKKTGENERIQSKESQQQEKAKDRNQNKSIKKRKNDDYSSDEEAELNSKHRRLQSEQRKSKQDSHQGTSPTRAKKESIQKKGEEKRRSGHGSSDEESDIRGRQQFTKCDQSSLHSPPEHTGDTDISMSDTDDDDDDDEEEEGGVKVISNVADEKTAEKQTSAVVTTNVADEKNSEKQTSLFAKKTTGDLLSDAKARYLARKGAVIAAVSTE